jgi:hypothetical protein
VLETEPVRERKHRVCQRVEGIFIITLFRDHREAESWKIRSNDSMIEDVHTFRFDTAGKRVGHQGIRDAGSHGRSYSRAAMKLPL